MYLPYLRASHNLLKKAPLIFSALLLPSRIWAHSQTSGSQRSIIRSEALCMHADFESDPPRTSFHAFRTEHAAAG